MFNYMQFVRNIKNEVPFVLILVKQYAVKTYEAVDV
jgi:hypothetical protein